MNLSFPRFAGSKTVEQKVAEGISVQAVGYGHAVVTRRSHRREQGGIDEWKGPREEVG
jgi:hypothetical protein